MEHPSGYDLRLAAHRQRVERIDAAAWKYPAPLRPNRLRTAVAAAFMTLAARPAPVARTEAASAN